jgi:hypothetical protein
MRDKLNNSPVAQMGLVAILLVVVGFLFLSQMGGGEEEGAETVTTTAPEGTTVAPAIGTEAEATSPATETAPPPVYSAAISVPKLPAPVTRAYDEDKTVVVLVVRNGGIDDDLVEPFVRELSRRSDMAVFVVPADQVARYAAITLGVQVDRTPALVVMRPKSLSDGTPQASVSYGFQSPQAIVQAAKDASYDGPEANYYPN